jgi:hypothetical protein
MNATAGHWSEMVSGTSDSPGGRVLIPCLADNIASARTTERNGGVLEGIRDTEHGPVKRYWIALDQRP